MNWRKSRDVQMDFGQKQAAIRQDVLIKVIMLQHLQTTLHYQ